MLTILTERTTILRKRVLHAYVRLLRSGETTWCEYEGFNVTGRTRVAIANALHASEMGCKRSFEAGTCCLVLDGLMIRL